MNDEEIKTHLDMMGTRCFIRFFCVFNEKIERNDMARKIHAEQNRQYENGEPAWEPWGKCWDSKPVLTRRVSPALQIIESGNVRRALEIARDSDLPTEDKQRAAELLRSYGHAQQNIGKVLYEDDFCDWLVSSRGNAESTAKSRRSNLRRVAETLKVTVSPAWIQSVNLLQVERDLADAGIPSREPGDNSSPLDDCMVALRAYLEMCEARDLR